MSNNNFSERLHNVIPGGAHTYSRGDDQFPLNAPPLLIKGEGAYVWDSEGRKYLDYGMGLRSVNIGYGNKEIAEEVYNEALKGNNLTRASLTELEAAELFVDMIPSVDMVKFAKHGSTVTTAAVKLARAYTNRKYVAIPFEQPFFSFDDWFIGSTIMNKGSLEECANYTLKFHFNDIDSLKELFSQYSGQISCVMLEPATHLSPSPTFLHDIQSLCHADGALFILDEMITGFRWHINGAQAYFDIEPDLTTFGKAMANGFAVAALGGKRDIMKIGGINKPGSERVFLTSTTHGAEMSALGAFMKTVEILKRDNVVDHFWSFGKNLIEGFNKIAESKKIDKYVYMEGSPCSPSYVTKALNNESSLELRTLFAEQMMNNGVIMPYVAISGSHGETELKATLSAVDIALEQVKNALEGDVKEYLKSPAIKPVFRKFN